MNYKTELKITAKPSSPTKEFFKEAAYTQNYSNTNLI